MQFRASLAQIFTCDGADFRRMREARRNAYLLLRASLATSKMAEICPSQRVAPKKRDCVVGKLDRSLRYALRFPSIIHAFLAATHCKYLSQRCSLSCLMIGGALVLSACSGQKSVSVQAMQKHDKQLGCQEAMLEMNEAEFYRKTAENNRGMNLKNLIMPLGYYSTYVSSQDAVQAATSRIEYLNRIYEIMRCEQQLEAGAQPMQPRNMPAAYMPAPMPAAPYMMPQMMGGYPGAYPMAYYAPSSYAMPAPVPPVAPSTYGPPNPYGPGQRFYYPDQQVQAQPMDIRSSQAMDGAL